MDSKCGMCGPGISERGGEEGRTVKATMRVATIMAKKTIEATMRTIEVFDNDQE